LKFKAIETNTYRLMGVSVEPLSEKFPLISFSRSGTK